MRRGPFIEIIETGVLTPGGVVLPNAVRANGVDLGFIETVTVDIGSTLDRTPTRVTVTFLPSRVEIKTEPPT